MACVCAREWRVCVYVCVCVFVVHVAESACTQVVLVLTCVLRRKFSCGMRGLSISDSIDMRVMYVCMYTALFACACVYRHKTIPADLLRPWHQSELQPYSCHCKFSNLSFPDVNKCSEHTIEFLTCLTCPFGMLCPPVDLKM